MRVDGNEVFVMCSAEIINVDEFIDDSIPLYLSEYKWKSYFNRFSASPLRKNPNAPARYLCDLMDSDVGLDHVTIFDFTKMLGDVGIAQINHSILSKAQILRIMNPS